MKQADIEALAGTKEAIADTKRLASLAEASLSEATLKGIRKRLTAHTRRAKKQASVASYDGLDGEWRDWLEVARRYEHKVPHQDREDIRHDIILELHRARVRDGQPIPILRAYRIASLMVALYWRQVNKASVKVCVYDGVAKEPHCASCSHKPKANRCVWLATRPVQSLDQPTSDYEGNECRLLDTIADDNAIDLDAWLDTSTWLLGCPTRLIEIATKKLDRIALNKNDQKYLERYRRKTQTSLF